MGISGSNSWSYVSTIFLAIFCGDIPLDRPSIPGNALFHKSPKSHSYHSYSPQLSPVIIVIPVKS